MGGSQSSCGQCCLACCPCCGCCPCCVPSDDDEAKRILPKKITPYSAASGKKSQEIDWYELLNKKLLASGDVTHGAIIDVDDRENLKAGNFQPTISGVRDIMSALLQNNTRAIDTHGITISDELPTYKPWIVDPYKAVYASSAEGETPDERKEDKAWVCIAVRTKKHIVIAACRSKTTTVQRHVLEVAKEIQKMGK